LVVGDVVVVVVLVDWLAIVSFDAGGVFCARAGEAIASAAIDAMRSLMTFLLLFGQRLLKAQRPRRLHEDRRSK
jgi:hypothetical protein